MLERKGRKEIHDIQLFFNESLFPHWQNGNY